MLSLWLWLGFATKLDCDRPTASVYSVYEYASVYSVHEHATCAQAEVSRLARLLRRFLSQQPSVLLG